ncbi:MAG: glycosyltransferase family 2 protein, partial [Clostridiales bacterium]|nr:glycosyltransferase family 2 protein [Clostridiales bacterium]
MAQTQILLACYNGRSYLDAQIRSIVSQSEPDWQLLMRDDGSFDGTNAILRAWAQREARLCLLADHKATGGAMTNFRLLAAASTAPYVMFCDQDDVWHPDKLQKTQQKMRAMERQFGADTPILVHSDLHVVDQDGREIAPSMAAYQKLDLTRTSFCQLLSQNVVTGCTVMVNRALLDLAAPWPDQAVMHDWYLALAAACFGQIGLVEEATLDYRQHGRNQVGSKNAGSAQ